MRSTLLMAVMIAAFFCPAPAGAEVIQCVYTEPFVNTSFDAHGKRVTVTRMGEKESQSFRVSVRTTGENWELANRRQAFRQIMVKDGKGSDGMSDTVFPYSATLTQKGLPHRLHGGCK